MASGLAVGSGCQSSRCCQWSQTWRAGSGRPGAAARWVEATPEVACCCCRLGPAGQSGQTCCRAHLAAVNDTGRLHRAAWYLKTAGGSSGPGSDWRRASCEACLVVMRVGSQAAAAGPSSAHDLTVISWRDPFGPKGHPPVSQCWSLQPNHDHLPWRPMPQRCLHARGRRSAERLACSLCCACRWSQAWVGDHHMPLNGKHHICCCCLSAMEATVL